MSDIASIILLVRTIAELLGPTIDMMPKLMDLIDRVEDGEEITLEEIAAVRAKAIEAVAKWDEGLPS